MKTLKLFSAFALFSILFISCSQQNNSGAVYFLENNLSEKLIITTTQQSGTPVVTSKNVDLYLSSSEFFNSHIDHLEAIEITRAFYNVSDVSVDLSSSTIKLGDMIVPVVNPSSEGVVEITDTTTLMNIARMLQENGSIRFSFEDTSSSTIDLEIDVTIELKGTFVN